MKQSNRRFLVLSLLLLILISILILAIIPRLGQERQPASGEVSPVGISSTMAQAEVVEIVEEGTIALAQPESAFPGHDG